MLLIKKFFHIFLILYFFNQDCFARTVGNYFGISAVKSSLSFAAINYFESDGEYQALQTNPTDQYSIGLKYNYAVNFKGFFLSPGIIYEHNNVKNNNNYTNFPGGSRQEAYYKSYSKINDRFGAKLDLGYDLTEDLSFYGTFGRAINYYKNYDSSYTWDLRDSVIAQSSFDPWQMSTQRKYANFYGAGFRIKMDKNFYVNGEFNKTFFNTRTKAKRYYKPDGSDLTFGENVFYYASSNDDYPDSRYFINNLLIIKLGIDYNF